MVLGFHCLWWNITSYWFHDNVCKWLTICRSLDWVVTRFVLPSTTVSTLPSAYCHFSCGNNFYNFICGIAAMILSSMLWYCCLGDRKGIWPEKKLAPAIPNAILQETFRSLGLTWNDLQKYSPVKRRQKVVELLWWCDRWKITQLKPLADCVLKLVEVMPLQQPVDSILREFMLNIFWMGRDGYPSVLFVICSVYLLKCKAQWPA